MHIGRGWEVSWGPEDCNGNAKMHCQCKLGVSLHGEPREVVGAPRFLTEMLNWSLSEAISLDWYHLTVPQWNMILFAHPWEQQTGWWKHQGSVVGATNDKAHPAS